MKRLFAVNYRNVLENLLLNVIGKMQFWQKSVSQNKMTLQ